MRSFHRWTMRAVLVMASSAPTVASVSLAPFVRDAPALADRAGAEVAESAGLDSSSVAACLPPNATQRGVRVLTEGSEPSLTRDGKMLAFVRQSELWVMDLATGRPRLILRQSGPHSPSWSPDGRRLVFDGEIPAIWIMNTNGSGLHKLIAPDSKGDRCPLWSPDGRSVVWTRGSHLWIADTSGANAGPLTPASKSGYEVACDWSPDGRTILYTASDGISSDFVLRLVGRDGRDDRADPTGVHADHAQWSQDGNAIYFDNGSICRMEHQSKGAVTRFARGESIDGVRLSLGPDGRFLVHDCLGEGDATDEIVLMPLR